MRIARDSWQVAMLYLLVALPATAQSRAWIDFDGTIKGESTDFRHENWIDIESFEISGRLAKDQIGEFAIRKKLDRASSQTFLDCAKGTRLPKATLDLDRSSATKETRLARLELEDVWFKSQQTSGAAGADSVNETVGLVFRKITYTYVQPDSTIASEAVEYFTADGGGGADTDGDGMPDAWEGLYGLSVGTNDSNIDLDGDGLINLHEFQLGTDPKSGTSFFKARLSPDPATPGLFQLTWNSVAGKVYVIEWSPDLKTPFAPVRVVTATAESTTENMTNSGNLGFYRVRPQ
jgi:type VI protein secretion system component Hcp